MANLNYAKMIIGGRVTADVELKQTQSGKACVNFSVAVSRRTGQESTTDFFDVVAFDKNAETVAKYFHKGSSILVEGTPTQREFTTRDGQKRKIIETVASRVCFVDSREEQKPITNDPSQYTPSQYTQTQYAAPAPSFNDISENEELPF